MSVSLPLEFVDSNVLVYAHDRSAGAKHEIARELLARLWQERSGALSIQALQEFTVNVTGKIPKPIGIPETLDILTALAEWRVHRPAARDVIEALEIKRRHQVSFWDAMILQSAASLGCRRLWSEDLSAGQSYNGVEVRNPFAEGPTPESA